MPGERGGTRRRASKGASKIVDSTVTITRPSPIERLMDWTFNQGPSTVVLILILVGGGYMVNNSIPKHIEQLGATQLAVEKSHREERERSIQISVEQREKDRIQRDRDREIMERMLDSLVPNHKKPENP
jgi:hypothetical protein